MCKVKVLVSLGYNSHFHRLVVNVQNQVYFIFLLFLPKRFIVKLNLTRLQHELPPSYVLTNMFKKLQQTPI